MMNRITPLLVSLALLTWSPSLMAQEEDDDSSIGGQLEDIALLFIEKGQFAEALEVYDELKEASPESLDILEMTVELCAKVPACTKRLPALEAELLAMFEDQHRDNPDNLELVDALFGMCMKMPSCTPRLPGLLAELSAFVKANPGSKEGRAMLIGYALDLKDYKTARAAVEDLVKIEPNNVSNWLWLADYHEQARDFRSLDALLAKLLKRFPKNAQIWLLQADRAISYGNSKRAQGALDTAKGLLGPKDIALRKRYDALTKELAQSIQEAIEAVHVDYRQDTRWSDLEDDFDHSTYP